MTVTSGSSVGNGSFMGKYETPRGGSLLGQDIIWETRVRMDVPPSFYFAIWVAGQRGAEGAEFDLGIVGEFSDLESGERSLIEGLLFNAGGEG